MADTVLIGCEDSKITALEKPARPTLENRVAHLFATGGSFNES